MIFKGIKTHIYNVFKIHVGHWVDELPSLIWSLRRSMNHLTGYMPLFLVYGAKVVIPSNLDSDAPRVRFYDEQRVEEPGRCRHA